MNKLRKRLRAFWKRQQLDRDLEDEMAFHLAMSTRESGDESAARRRLGNTAVLKETCRDLWAFTRIEAWWQDFRYALRTLAKNPLLTVTAVIALGLGIGANTTVFTVVSSALRFDMGVDHVDRLVVLNPGEAAESVVPESPPFLDFAELRKEVRSLSVLAAYRFSAVNVSDGRALPERYWRARMTASGWAMVRPKPVLGRGFQAQDESPDATPAVLLSHRIWQQRYGGDSSILGKPVRVDDVPHVVIGVMPAGTQFPEDADLWTPLTAADALQGALRHDLLVFGRLADGVTLAAAQSEVNAIARREYSGKVNGPLVRVRPFLELIGVYDQRPLLIAMVFAVGFVLLIVCADVANLLLARASARAREISIRIAIGAGRARIIRQLLVESVLLSATGGLAGWMVALAGLHWFDSMSAAGRRPSWVQFSMDTTGFLYLAAISIGAGILFGLAPALQLAKVDVNRAIKDGGRGAEGGAGGRRLAGLLVGFQMALCVVLLAGAGLMIHSTLNLYNTPMAINPSNVLTMRISLPEVKYSSPQSVRAFYTNLKTTLRTLPGVGEVALTSSLPMSGWRDYRGETEGGRLAEFAALIVDANYFQTLAAPLRRGRSFSESEAASASQVIVNESFAAKFWPGEDPLGKLLRLTGDRGPQGWLEVIGLAPDVQQDLFRPLGRNPLLYLSEEAAPQRSVSVMARTAVPPNTLVETFRRTVQSLDENLPAQDVLSLDEQISRQRLNVSAFGKLFSLFAGIALLLAWVGLYAVVAHAVSRRTQEIGIRMAMGGTRKDILRLVLKQGMRQVVGGCLAGIPLAILVTRALSRALVGVKPSDPATYAGVALVLGVAGLLGCAIPARRAVRIDPLAALRHE